MLLGCVDPSFTHRKTMKKGRMRLSSQFSPPISPSWVGLQHNHVLLSHYVPCRSVELSWLLHRWGSVAGSEASLSDPRDSLFQVCPAVPAASRLVPCWLYKDFSCTQWWPKLLCGMWFLFNPGPGQCWGLPAFCWPCAHGRSPPKSLWPLLFTPGDWSQAARLCPASAPPWCLLQSPCQPAAQLQLVLVRDALPSLSAFSSSTRFIWMGWVGVLTDTAPVPWSAAFTFSCWFLKEPLMRWWISSRDGMQSLWDDGYLSLCTFLKHGNM